MASSRDMPSGTRQRTPSHPPYSLMIDTALRSLAEEGGSTQDVISAYIVANYDGLPWGHDKLLPYYLQKLTDQGEFAAVGPGRYSISAGDNEPRHGFASTHQNAEGSTTSATKRRGRPHKRNKLHARIGALGPEDYQLLADANI